MDFCPRKNDMKRKNFLRIFWFTGMEECIILTKKKESPEIDPNYDGAGPLMVFGDSAGDWNMMTDWMESGDTQLGVIFNRYRKTSDPIWQGSTEAAESIGNADARFVLQGRDENHGQLRPSEYSILLGETEEVLVRPAE